MTNWTDGYVADIGYTYGSYPELNPLAAKLPLLNAGYKCPEFKNACELGYGQGLNINISASATNVQWYGTDFNPSQASFARNLAAISETGANLFDDSFVEFLHRDNLPEFDFIGMHGIWSWVSDENRRTIVQFLKKKLKVGGVLYISYNTTPGWTPINPIREVLLEHTRVASPAGSSKANQIISAINFAKDLIKHSKAYTQVNPTAEARIFKMADQETNYLAHEYFNSTWTPMSHSTLSVYLEDAKLTYVCSAQLYDHFPSINLTTEQQEFLNKIENKTLRESTYDFMTNQQFRRDYWIKGPTKLTALERTEALRSHRVILSKARNDISLTINTSLGDMSMKPEIYSPILDNLSDLKSKTLGEIERDLSVLKIGLSEIVQAILMLVQNGSIAYAQEKSAVDKFKNNTKRLNNEIINFSRASKEISYLASPVTGGAVGIGRFQQLFIAAARANNPSPESCARYVWGLLEAQNQRIILKGQPLTAPEDNIRELKSQAEIFLSSQLPVINALGVS